MVENIGFIGLGSMGSGMAARLVAMDVPLWVYDTRPDACELLEREGAIVAENVARLGQSCKRIILSLPDVVVVERVLFGEGGLLQSLQPGSDVIDCGTTHPDKTRDIAQRLMEEDVAFLDAPVSGMETRAADGTLTIMVGGDAAAYSRCEPLLKEMGELVLHMGPSGSGQLMKMTNNVLYNISIAAMAEMLPLAVRLGLDPEKVYQVVSTGSGQSFGFDYHAARAMVRRFDQGYPLASAYKDMTTLLERANEQHAAMPVASAAMQTYRMALAQGFGGESKAAMIKVWEQALEVEVRGGTR
ncbi:MAG TPA: NAD(P)-dependent oxidoreductase [Candidatus Latescibacteria bacterium]|nr:2-hydroxymethylglutarate dehydrogenase [Gemmatimonadota bacterium]MDP7365139.1 NAD(P)-dependent oxidoreductase [Candidatus Latescibacterota bacterium]HCV25011.1 NAD(P)-dependent oxidoreductase [Candidatus Latescibacterota bacterium]HJN26386.1 NAD(P)-dependent oxidoreductase [Candidatus Latescibacterota bacterium]